MSFGNVIIGEDALWSSVALEYLSKKLDSWEPGSEWARRVSALAVALQPDFLLKIGGRRLPFSLFNRVHVIGDDDAFWGSTALTFFGNQIKEREPVWASTFAAVTEKVRPHATVKIARLRRPLLVQSPEYLERTRDLWILVEKSNIVGGGLVPPNS